MNMAVRFDILNITIIIDSGDTMFKILSRTELNDSTVKLVVEAPRVAAKARPGQFVILRGDEYAERIPLTVADCDTEKGSVTVIFQTVGASTIKLGKLREGSYICDFVGPLGRASELDGYGRVAVIGGGLGCAIAYPQAKYLASVGTQVDIIAGFRSKDLIILEKEMRECGDLTIMTDDGSNGNKGLVTDGLRRKIEDGAKYDLVIAIGPPIMMKFVCLLTKEFGIKTVVSMNPIMIDGTGMCGGCRVSVGGETKFACVDGPDFDGHLVDFDLLMRRNRTFIEQEKHACNLLKQGEKANG